MLKLRIWGENAEIERMIETVCNRTPNVRVLSVSKPYKDRGASVYERCYMDIEIHEIVSTPTEENEIKKLADKLAAEKSNWKVCDFDDEYFVNLLPSAQRLHAAGFGNVEQAVREFAEELKLRSCTLRNSTFDNIECVSVLAIDCLLKELYGK